MATFFSGTDQATLLEEGGDRNHFVSLIVNNAGTYTAAITRRVKYNEVREVEYDTFGGETVKTKEVITDREELEWFNLDIEKEVSNEEFEFIDTRLATIKKAKEAKKPISTTTNIYNIPSYSSHQKIDDAYDWRKYYKSFKEDDLPWEYPVSEDPTLFDELPEFKTTPKAKSEVPTEVEKIFPPKVIKDCVIQLLTGSILADSENKLDINIWVDTMESLFDRRFGAHDPALSLFENWAMGQVEYLLWFAVDFGEADEDECRHYLMEKLVEELSKFKSNKYIEKYIEIIMSYGE